MVEASEGFYHVFPARMSTREHLELLGRSVATWRGLNAPLAYPDWTSAMRDMFSLADTNTVPVVLDGIAGVLDTAPEVASLTQYAFDAARDKKGNAKVRMILCGSALS